MCIISLNRAHINFLGGIFGSKKGVPNGPFGPQNVWFLVFCALQEACGWGESPFEIERGGGGWVNADCGMWALILLTFSILVSEDFLVFPDLHSDHSAYLYSPAKLLKTLRPLGTSGKAKKSSRICKERRTRKYRAWRSVKAVKRSRSRPFVTTDAFDSCGKSCDFWTEGHGWAPNARNPYVIVSALTTCAPWSEGVGIASLRGVKPLFSFLFLLCHRGSPAEGVREQGQKIDEGSDKSASTATKSKGTLLSDDLKSKWFGTVHPH